MKQFPDVPPIDEAPDGLLEGHLWILERIDGAPLRFQLQASGLLRFGDGTRTTDDPAELPDPYRHAVDHVRERLDREALRNAVEEVTDVVFFGWATQRHAIDYDWERLPSFLGTDVWSADAGAYRPPDAVAGIFDRLGLASVNAFQRELPARDFDPDAYELPDSAWDDGPAAGAIVRNKRGGRARLDGPAATADPSIEPDATAAQLAEQFGTDRRFERLARELDDRGAPVTADAMTERAADAAARELRPQLYGDAASVDPATFRTELGALTRAFLEEWAEDRW